MRQDTRIQIIAVGILALCVAGSAAIAPALTAEAGRAQLGYADRVEDSDPPEVAVGIAMGAFRGVFVNLLWFRANKLKEEGKFHEAIELARTITRLQPRFPRVWVFQAWNLAYNISVATHTDEERWQWVNAGIEILRSEGIPKNPNNTLLHKELAWIFIHKIQGITDDANHFYKRRLAQEWTFALGQPPPPPRPDDGDVREILSRLVQEDDPNATLGEAMRRASVNRRIGMLESIESAPSTLDELYVLRPEARSLVRRLREEAGLNLDINLLRQWETEAALLRTWSVQELGYAPSDIVRNRNLAFIRLLEEERYTDAWADLILHVRKRLLNDRYRMEIPRMIRYTRKYGPLDWRIAASHSLYWAARGVEQGMGRLNVDDFDLTNTDRIMLHSVQELFRWGQVHYDLLNNSYIAMLNLDFTDAYGEVLTELEKRARFFEDPDNPFRAHRSFGTGYENFLRDVIRTYYRMGDVETAQRYFERLRTSDRINLLTQDEILRHEFSMPIEDFIVLDMEERIISPQVAWGEVVTSLRDAFVRGLLQGDVRIYEGQMKYAEQVHEVYMSEQHVRTLADPQATRMGGFMPERFADAAAEVLVDLISSGVVGPNQAGLIWRRTTLGLAQVAYDPLRERMRPRLGDAFGDWFPEPPGMEEYRVRRQQLDAQLDQRRRERMRIEQR